MDTFLRNTTSRFRTPAKLDNTTPVSEMSRVMKIRSVEMEGQWMMERHQDDDAWCALCRDEMSALTLFVGLRALRIYMLQAG